MSAAGVLKRLTSLLDDCIMIGNNVQVIGGNPTCPTSPMTTVTTTTTDATSYSLGTVGDLFDESSTLRLHSVHSFHDDRILRVAAIRPDVHVLQSINMIPILAIAGMFVGACTTS